jgi:hypothetical protein
MANFNNPNGFTPVGTISGSNWQGKVRQYIANSDTAADLAIGDAVTMEAGGNLELAGAGGVVFGVVVGVKPVDELSAFGEGSQAHVSGLNLEDNRFDKSAGVDKYVMVAVGPDVLYEVQGDETGNGIADIGSPGDLVGGASGTARSIQELDTSDVDAATTTSSFMVYDIVRRPDNEVGAANDRYIVAIHEYQFADAIGGI